MDSIPTYKQDEGRSYLHWQRGFNGEFGSMILDLHPAVFGSENSKLRVTAAAVSAGIVAAVRVYCNHSSLDKHRRIKSITCSCS
jgi:hypothetical protein